jgi:hypothetical protein
MQKCYFAPSKKAFKADSVSKPRWDNSNLELSEPYGKAAFGAYDGGSADTQFAHLGQAWIKLTREVKAWHCHRRTSAFDPDLSSTPATHLDRQPTIVPATGRVASWHDVALYVS